MNDNILTTAVKIAKIIDDNIDRDEALSKIAQMQTACNYTDDAWETITQIRYVDIRANAIRKSLDNQLARFFSKKETMPELDWWIEKLMEETLAIPNINDRCSSLHSIILYILPRLDNKETAVSLLSQARAEFAQLDNPVDRSKYLFAVCEMFQQLNIIDEATATIELIQERIIDIKPYIQQGLLLGLLAHEYWKMQDYMSAFECIGRIDNREIQSYAYLQLVELLSNSGQFSDAELIVEQQEERKPKNIGRLLVNMGKNVFRSFPKDMKNIVFNISKSMVFHDELEADDNSDSEDAHKSVTLGKPTWVNLLLVVKYIVKNKDFDLSQSDEDKSKNQNNIKIVQENLIESYVQISGSNLNEPDDDDDNNESWKSSDKDDDNESWKSSDDDDDAESWKGLDDDDDAESWRSSDDDDDSESWKGSDDDDDSESWKNSDDDDDSEDWDDSENDDDQESWKNPDEVEESEDESDDDGDKEDESDDDNKNQNLISDLINNEWNHLPFAERIRKLHELFLEKVVNFNHNLREIPKEKCFCLLKTSQGIISFNQALPPELLQQLLRRIFKLFHAVKSKEDKEKPSPRKREIKDFTNRIAEIGFDDAWQNVISHGDYKFAVECALYYFYTKHKSELFFGCEYTPLFR